MNELETMRAERDALRKLLRRYVNHVGESEGTDFLSDRWPSPELTDSDRTAIQDIAYGDEPEAEQWSCPRCGSGRWVDVGLQAVRQCLNCGWYPGAKDTDE